MLISQVKPHIPSTINISIEGPIVFPDLQIWNLKQKRLKRRKDVAESK